MPDPEAGRPVAGPPERQWGAVDVAVAVAGVEESLQEVFEVAGQA